MLKHVLNRRQLGANRFDIASISRIDFAIGLMPESDESHSSPKPKKPLQDPGADVNSAVAMAHKEAGNWSRSAVSIWPVSKSQLLVPSYAPWPIRQSNCYRSPPTQHPNGQRASTRPRRVT